MQEKLAAADYESHFIGKGHVSKHDEFCFKNEEFCIENEEF